MAQATGAQVGDSDVVLMRRVQGDDTQAFELLYDRYASRALRTARAVCRDAGRAEDVVQESFLYVWRNRTRFRRTGSFQGWIQLVVRHRAIDSCRHEATRPPVAEAKGDRSASVSSVPAEVIARDEAENLRASLARLPEAQAEVIALAFFEQLSHSEIARLLELPPGTVKGRMRHGLEKLAQDLEAARTD